MFGTNAFGEYAFGETVSTADTAPPTMTGNLSVNSITANSFTVTWQAATDDTAVTGYKVSKDGGTSYTDVGNVLAYSFTGLTGNTGYAVRVYAYDAAGNNATPLTTSVTTSAVADTTVPVLTGSITSSNITSSSFTLTYPAATDNIAVTGYEVSTDAGGTYVDAGNILSVNKTGLAASTLYNTRVRAYDAAGNRSAALSLAVTTTAVVAPGGTLVPSVRTLGAISPTSVTLGATPVSFTYNQNKSQSIILYNKSGSSVVVNILGSAAPIVIIPNTGGIAVNLATGWNVTVPTGFTRLELDRAFAFLVGATTITANTENAVLAALVV